MDLLKFPSKQEGKLQTHTCQSEAWEKLGIAQPLNQNQGCDVCKIVF